MAKMVTISFKDNEMELQLYNFLKSKSSPSYYIKELMLKDIETSKTDSSVQPKLDREYLLSIGR